MFTFALGPHLEEWTYLGRLVLIILWLGGVPEIIGFPVMVFSSLLRRKLQEHKIAQQLRLEDTLDGILPFSNGILDSE